MPSRWDIKSVEKVLDTNRYRNSFTQMTLFKYRKENTHTLEKYETHLKKISYFPKCERYFSNKFFKSIPT